MTGEDGITILQNVDHCLPDDAAWRPKRLCSPDVRRSQLACVILCFA